MRTCLIILMSFIIFFNGACERRSPQSGLPPQGDSLISEVASTSGNEDEPEVVMAIPTGAVSSVEDYRTIRVVFNQPMVPLTVLQKSERTGPIAFEPHIEGTYSWQGTSTLIFTPSADLPRGKSYKASVSPTLKTLSGDSFSEEYKWHFETLRPELADSLPAQGGKFVPTAGPFYLYFNCELKTEEIKSYISLEEVATKKVCDFSVRKVNDQDKDKLKEDWSANRVAVVVPTNPLKTATQYQLVLKAGLTDQKDSLGLAQEKRLTFTSQNVFALVKSKDVVTIKPEDGFPISFSNPVSAKELVKHMSFSPKVEIPSYYAGYDDAREHQNFYADFAANTEYTVHIKAGLKDLNGNVLGKDTNMKFKTLNFHPYLGVAQGQGVAESKQKGLFPVYAVNVDSATVKMAKLTKDQIIPTSKILFENPQNVTAPAFGIERSWQIKSALNKGDYHPIDLKQVLGNSSTGIVYLCLENLKFQNQSFDSRNESQIQVTNMGISAKTSPENTLIWVTSLDSGKPLADVSLEIRGADNKVYWKGKTDKEGLAMAKGWAQMGLKHSSQWQAPEVWIIAEKSGDLAYISSLYDWSVPTWYFDVSYDYAVSETGKDYNVSMFTDKGLYKPGEDVHVKGICRKKESSKWQIPKGESLVIYQYNSRGEEVSKQTVKVSDWGSFNFSVPVSSQAPTGEYRFSCILPLKERQLYLCSSYFHVESYKPADFAVKMDGNKSSYILGDMFKGSVEGKWLFGAPMNGSQVEWRISAEPSFFVPKGYEGYSFGCDDPEPFEGEFAEDGTIALASGKGKLNDGGKLEISAQLKNNSLRRPCDMYVEGTVTGAAREEISNSKLFTLHNADYYIGLKNKSFVVKAGETQSISLVTVTPEGKPLIGKDLKVEFLKREWHSVRKESLSGGKEWVSEQKDESLKEFAQKSAKDAVVLNFPTEKPGYYITRVSGTDALGNTAITECGFYVSGRDYVGWSRSDDDIVELVKDKKEYKPGEKAKIVVKSPYEQATALVTLERESVLDKRLVEIKGSADVIEVPLRESDAPNLFVSVVLVQGRMAEEKLVAGEDLGKPSFKIGYTEISVVSEKEKLALTIHTDSEKYRPGQKVSVDLSLADSSGKGVQGEIVLTAVDEGVRSLIDYKLPDLFTLFYGSRSLAVSSADSRTHIIGQRNFGEKGDNPGGGGGNMQRQEDNLGERKLFKDNACWKPSIITDKQGKAKIDFVLPDNLTTFKIMAVAGNKTSFSAMQSKDITVSKPLILKSALPSYTNIGDAFEAGVVVHNTTNKRQRVAVTLDCEGLDVKDRQLTKETVIGAGLEKEILFSFAATNQGEAQLHFSAVMGNESDKLYCSLPVQLSQTSMETMALSRIMKTENAQEEILLPENVDKSLGDITVTMGNSVMERLGVGFLELKNYPYECLEQKISKVFPALFAPQLFNSAKSEDFPFDENYDAYVKSFVKEVKNHQTDNGGFKLWAGSEQEREFLSCYAMHALLLAEDKGYAVDRSIITSGLKYLNTLVNKPVKDAWTLSYNNKEKYSLKAYALYVLYLAADPSADSRLAVLWERRADMNLFGQAMLLKAIHLSGKRTDNMITLTKAMQNKLKTGVDSSNFEDDFGPTSYLLYDSQIRSNAIVLQAFSEVGIDRPGVVRWLIDAQRKGHWQSTNNNAFSIYALSTYMDKFEGKDKHFQAKALLNEKPIIETDFNDQAVVSKKLALSELSSNKEQMVFSKTGSNPLYYNVRMTYMPPGKVPARDQGLAVFKMIEPVEKTIARTNTLNAGDTYKVTLSVVASRDRNYVLLHDPIPAGFDVINTTFSTERKTFAGLMRRYNSKALWTTFDHWEIYDDKVLLFADTLSQGEHQYTYFMRAKNFGTFVMHPTKAFLMYEPEVFGNTDSKKIIIK